ncbi:MAG: protein phosphatase 2C domain-containing protein [Myxococcota bacterium]
MDHSWGYGSDQRLREENQDCFGVFDFPDYTLAIVCDGMGGHVGGAHASTLAVRTIHDVMRELQGRPVAAALEEAIQRTNVVIYEAARKNHRLMGMGTTVVAAVITRDTCVLAHVGDSRAYLVRRSQLTQMTRDHTMVNLFVDAELLSPEDAATHPEAHVLSRSLGVERTVDVELSDPIPLEASDVVFLCSDGVHGIVTDWEISSKEWGAPHQATKEILKVVGAREGDDNATGVAVLMGTSYEDVPATPVPEPKRFDEGGMAQPGMTAVPIDEELDPPSGSRGSADAGPGGGYIVYEEHPILEPQSERKVMRTPDQGPPPKAAPTTTPKGATGTTGSRGPDTKNTGAASSKGGKPAKAKPKRRTALWLPVAFAGSALLAMLCAVSLLLIVFPSSPDAGGPDGLDPLDLPPDPVPKTAAASQPPGPRPEVPTSQPGQPVAAPQPGGAELPPAPTHPGATQCPVPGYLLKPVLPPKPRRLPTRAQLCNQPPPGGPDTMRAIEASRRPACSESLAAVQSGMKKSIDHCRLFESAWRCFNEIDQRALESVKAKSWAELVLELPHFEGTRESREAQLANNPQLQRLPQWFVPPTDGLDRRLEEWSADPVMQQYVKDLLGDADVADDLALDLHLSALTAAGLACTPPKERSKALEDAWARRVYVLSRALSGSAGQQISAHRQTLMPVLHDLLAQSVADYVDPNGHRTPVPAQVRDAYEVGRGDRPSPTAARPAPTRPIEDPQIPDDEDVQINRGG